MFSCETQLGGVAYSSDLKNSRFKLLPGSGHERHKIIFQYFRNIPGTYRGSHFVCNVFACEVILVKLKLQPSRGLSIIQINAYISPGLHTRRHTRFTQSGKMRI